MKLETWIDIGVLPLLAAALLLSTYRVLRGPTSADRVVALDHLATTGIGIACALAVRAGEVALGDAVLVIALLSFLATLGYARFLGRPQ